MEFTKNIIRSTTVALTLLCLLLTLGGCVSSWCWWGDDHEEVCEEVVPVATDAPRFVATIQMQGGLYHTESRLIEYVRAVGTRVAAASEAPDLPYRFQVIHSGTPEAWAIPEGKIAIHRGLLMQLESEAELAAILAREVVLSAMPFVQGTLTSVEGRDFAVENPVFSYAPETPHQKFLPSRTKEEIDTANAYARIIIERAGYDPRALVTAQQKLLSLRAACSENISPEDLRRLEQLIAIEQRGGEEGREFFARNLEPLKRFFHAYQKLDHAIEALKNGAPQTAIQLAQEGLRAAPHEGRFHHVIGAAYGQLGHHSNAVAQLNRAIDTDDTYFDCYLQRGLSYAGLGYSEQAKNDLRSSLSLLKTAEAHYHLGHLLYEGRAPQEAITHFEAAATVDSPVMLLAQEELARLDLPSQPTKYLHLQAALDERGFLSLAIVNDCSIPVRDVFVSIDAVGAPNVHIPTHIIRYSEPTSEGGKQVLYTGAGPFENTEQLKRSLKAEIISAEPYRAE